MAIFFWLPKTTTNELVIAIPTFLIATILMTILVHKLILATVLSQNHPLPLRWAIPWGIFSYLAGFWLSVNIPIAYPPGELNSYVSIWTIRLLYRISTGMGIGVVLYFVSFWIATASPGHSGNSKPFKSPLDVFKYALPMAIVWGVYLLAFFPGMMSADSMVQWGQILTGQFNDHHPIFHTLLLWLLTRITLSPAVIAVAQIIALSLVAGAWLAFFEKVGIKKWVIWIAAFLFAVSPVNGTMVNTLWKDIPYSIAVMGLTLILALVVFTNGGWVHRYQKAAILGIVIALVLLLRYDGLPLGIGTLLVCVIFYPREWKSWLLSGLICATLYFGVRGPLYSLLKVEKTTFLADASLSVIDIAAYSIQGSKADQLISAFELSNTTWSCDIWNGLGPDWRVTDLDQSIPVYQAAMNLSEHIPGLLLYDYRCSRSLEWIIWDPTGEVRNTSHVEVLVDPNPYGIEPDSIIPGLRDWISDWVITTSYDTSLNWFIWRPPLFLYLQMLITAVLILRNRNIRYSLLSLPVLLQSITFSLILAMPNFRYHYAVYLIALISIPLLFSPPQSMITNRENDKHQKNK
ncbi:MAG: hypothetical protein JXR32_10500 [Anaerolineaceae bacterium]|nr:hypothetical protein [Anaerolineaceae bacterium]